jgi:hypothetical protein
MRRYPNGQLTSGTPLRCSQSAKIVLQAYAKQLATTVGLIGNKTMQHLP